MSIVIHRWEYKPDLRLTECVPLPFGGVESHQYCIGCGERITDFQIHQSGLPRDIFSVDILSKRRPIEEGTLEAYKFRKSQS